MDRELQILREAALISMAKREEHNVKELEALRAAALSSARERRLSSTEKRKRRLHSPPQHMRDAKSSYDSLDDSGEERPVTPKMFESDDNAVTPPQYSTGTVFTVKVNENVVLKRMDSTPEPDRGPSPIPPVQLPQTQPDAKSPPRSTPGTLECDNISSDEKKSEDRSKVRQTSHGNNGIPEVGEEPNLVSVSDKRPDLSPATRSPCQIPSPILSKISSIEGSPVPEKKPKKKRHKKKKSKDASKGDEVRDLSGSDREKPAKRSKKHEGDESSRPKIDDDARHDSTRSRNNKVKPHNDVSSHRNDSVNTIDAVLQSREKDHKTRDRSWNKTRRSRDESRSLKDDKAKLHDFPEKHRSETAPPSSKEKRSGESDEKPSNGSRRSQSHDKSRTRSGKSNKKDRSLWNSLPTPKDIDKNIEHLQKLKKQKHESRSAKHNTDSSSKSKQKRLISDMCDLLSDLSSADEDIRQLPKKEQFSEKKRSVTPKERIPQPPTDTSPLMEGCRPVSLKSKRQFEQMKAEMNKHPPVIRSKSFEELSEKNPEENIDRKSKVAARADSPPKDKPKTSKQKSKASDNNSSVDSKKKLELRVEDTTKKTEIISAVESVNVMRHDTPSSDDEDDDHVNIITDKKQLAELKKKKAKKTKKKKIKDDKRKKKRKRRHKSDSDGSSDSSSPTKKPKVKIDKSELNKIVQFLKQRDEQQRIIDESKVPYTPKIISKDMKSIEIKLKSQPKR